MSHVLPAAGVTTVDWWRDLLSRAWRQATQTAVPILAAVVSQGAGGLDPAAVSTGVAGAVLVTVLKFLAYEMSAYKPSASPVTWVRIADRVVPAVVGVYAGVSVTGLADMLTVDWAQTSWLALFAGVLAVLGTAADPADVATTPKIVGA